MVNKRSVHTSGLGPAARLVWVYLMVVVATLVALAVLTTTRSSQATPEAWGHAVVVGAFAVLLVVRMRSARGGNDRAVIAVGVIAIVLLTVNLVEALIPGLFPIWMRVEMIGIAAMMAVLAALVFRGRRRENATTVGSSHDPAAVNGRPDEA